MNPPFASSPADPIGRPGWVDPFELDRWDYEGGFVPAGADAVKANDKTSSTAPLGVRP